MLMKEKRRLRDVVVMNRMVAVTIISVSAWPGGTAPFGDEAVTHLLAALSYTFLLLDHPNPDTCILFYSLRWCSEYESRRDDSRYVDEGFSVTIFGMWRRSKSNLLVI